MAGTDRLSVAALLLVLVVARANLAGAQAPVVRDSAGIAIVENSGSARPTFSHRIAATPSVQIGQQDGPPEYQFTRIVAVGRLADGSIAVADAEYAEIRIFDASGRFVRKMGRRGQGPGEFQSLGWIRVLPRDSILAADLTGRLTLFDPLGAVVRSWNLDAPWPVPPPARPGFSGAVMSVTMVPNAFADGSFLSYRTAPSRPGPELKTLRDTMVVARFSAGGVHLDDVGRFLALEKSMSRGEPVRRASGGVSIRISIAGVPFPRETFVRAGDSVFYTGDGSTYEIQVRDRSGALVRIIRKLQPNRPVTADMIARHRVEMGGQRGTLDRPIAPAGLDAEFYPRTLPAFAELELDAGRRLWVREYPAPGESPPRWSLFAPDGRFLGTVDTPPGVQLLEIGNTSVLGVWRDDLDVEYVRVYPLVPVP